MTAAHVNQKPNLCFFFPRRGISRLPLGATHAFSPALEDTVRLWRTSSVPSHSVGGSSYHKGATERMAWSGSRGPPTCLSFGLLLSLSFPVAMLGKASGSRVSLPVSRRESRRRCGGRRGGLNDSQHCAVGPGLQSPQRWSFPPPPSHSPSPSTQHAAAPLSPSNQPFRYAETSAGSRRGATVPVSLHRPTLSDLRPKL